MKVTKDKSSFEKFISEYVGTGRAKLRVTSKEYRNLFAMLRK